MTDDVLAKLTVTGGQPPADTSSNSTTGDYLSQLVGEGKKFKSTEDLARSKLEADKHLSQIEMENKDLRRAVEEFEQRQARAVTLQEILDEIKRASENKGSASTPQAFDPSSISDLVNKAIVDRESGTVRKTNRNLVNSVLNTKFNGDTNAAVQFVQKVAQDNKMSHDTLIKLTEESPEAFIKLAGLGDTTKGNSQGNPLAIPGRGNTEGSNSESNVRDNAYYDKLRKEMGFAKYFNNLELQRQKMKDMDALGDRFFATN